MATLTGRRAVVRTRWIVGYHPAELAGFAGAVALAALMWSAGSATLAGGALVAGAARIVIVLVGYQVRGGRVRREARSLTAVPVPAAALLVPVTVGAPGPQARPVTAARTGPVTVADGLAPVRHIGAARPARNGSRPVLSGDTGGQVTRPPVAIPPVDGDERTPRTVTGPVLVIDIDRLGGDLRRLRAALGVDVLHHAVRRSADPEVLGTVADGGGGFEISTHAELVPLLAIGVDPAAVLFANPVKPVGDVQLAYAAGVRRFVVDSTAELLKIASAAPGASVVARLTLPAPAADTSIGDVADLLASPYGVDARAAYRLLCTARSLGLRPYGLVVDLGTEPAAPAAWGAAIAHTAAVARALLPYKIRLGLLGISGGVPTDPDGDAATDAYGTVIAAAVERCWPYRPVLAVEPGRAPVAACGTLVATVIGVASRHGRRWLHLDVAVDPGQAGGPLTACRLGDSRRGVRKASYQVAAPGCDRPEPVWSGVLLSSGIREGDRIFITPAGTDLAGRSTPVRTVCVGGTRIGPVGPVAVAAAA